MPKIPLFESAAAVTFHSTLDLQAKKGMNGRCFLYFDKRKSYDIGHFGRILCLARDLEPMKSIFISKGLWHCFCALIILSMTATTMTKDHDHRYGDTSTDIVATGFFHCTSTLFFAQQVLQ